MTTPALLTERCLVGKHSRIKLATLQRLARYKKFIVSVIGAIAAASTQIGIVGVPNTWEEWLQIAIYFATAGGVYQVKNKKDSTDVV